MPLPRTRPMVQRPPGPLVPNANGTSYRIADPDEYSSCPNASAVMAATRDHIMHRFDNLYYFGCQKERLYEDQLDDVIPALLATCKSFGITRCNEPSCVQNREVLDDFVPQSEYFPCLREWVKQVVACLHSQGPQLLKPFPKESSSSLDRSQGDPDPLAEVLSLLSWICGYLGPYNEAISPPAPLRVVAMRDPAEIKAYGINRMRGEIDKAIERAKTYNICLRRAWVVVSILPGAELNLPALIPGPDSPAIEYLDHDRWHEHDESVRHNLASHEGTRPESPRIQHSHCTEEKCEQAKINATYISQLHVCQSADCALTDKNMFPTKKLMDAIEGRRLTAWSLDGRSVFGGNAFGRFEEDEPFIAISHVWADGTGVGNPEVMQGRVRSCLFRMFCDIARKLRCKGVWWDAICIPSRNVDPDRLSLKFMEKNYSAAKYTVVHDLYLRRMPWIDAESACLAIVLSSWFTRGWTALEHARSDDIYVIFAESDEPSTGYVLKNLERDILLPSREAGSACQLVTRSIVQALRKGTRGYLSPFSPGVSHKQLLVNDILISLKGRSTSWASDLPDIACLLAELELPLKPKKPYTETPPPDPNFCHRVLQGRGITAENLFHVADAAEGFGWQPASFLDLPLSTRNRSSLFRISPAPPTGPPATRRVHSWISAPHARRGRSDVIGSWSFICDPSPNPDFLNNVQFYWPENDKRSMETHDRIEMAITDAMHHIILVDRSERYPHQGILVKVRRWSSGTTRPSDMEAVFGVDRSSGQDRLCFNSFKEDISFPCEFVGVVHFSSSELPIMTAATFIMFGTDDENLASDLDPRWSAWFFIKSNVQGLNTQSLFGQKQNNVGRWSNQKPENNIWEDSTNIPDVLQIPRMRTDKFASQIKQDYTPSGYDQIRLSDLDGLFTRTTQRYWN